MNKYILPLVIIAVIVLAFFGCTIGAPMVECGEGYTSCDPPDAGHPMAEYQPVCADLSIDAKNCGACGTECPASAQYCFENACCTPIACPAGNVERPACGFTPWKCGHRTGCGGACPTGMTCGTDNLCQ